MDMTRGTSTINDANAMDNTDKSPIAPTTKNFLNTKSITNVGVPNVSIGSTVITASAVPVGSSPNRKPEPIRKISAKSQASQHSTLSVSSFEESDKLDRSKHSLGSSTLSTHTSRRASHRESHVHLPGGPGLYSSGSSHSPMPIGIGVASEFKGVGKKEKIVGVGAVGIGSDALSNIEGGSNANAHGHKRISSSTSSSNVTPQLCKPIPNNVKIPRMKNPSKCKLFCAFYAEFDNKVGPKVSFQSPNHFMDHDIAVTTPEIEALLAKSFKCVGSENVTVAKGPDKSGAQEVSNAGGKNKNEKDAVEEGLVSQQESDQDGDEKPTVPQNSQSIFDSTCEYIITGNELTGQIISLSTHNMHIITRPTIIHNKMYERNSLLFSVGFVIRRITDPSPFRPLLSRLASTLRAMEIESGFLSSPTAKLRIQCYLDTILPSLNSPDEKCHLLLDDANVLHLQYFPPPKIHAPSVPDFAVPVLLRPEYMLLSVDWDLSLNWIVPHINGIKHAKLIAETCEVDEEMVLSGLRVLRHHGVLACVDIFRYSNRYESTSKAQQMLAGDLDALLEEAFHFVDKGHSPNTETQSYSFGLVGNMAVKIGSAAGFGNVNTEGTMTLLPPIPCGTPSSYPPVRTSSEYDPRDEFAAYGAPLSSSHGALDRGSHMTNILQHQDSPGRRTSSTSASLTTSQWHQPPLSIASSTPSSTIVPIQNLPPHLQSERKMLMTALAILYASCERHTTLREVLVSRVKSTDYSRGMQDISFSPPNTRRRVANAQLNNDVSVSDIDWKEVFNHFDHRRFVTFGVIKGLIRRVHEYPIVCDDKKDDEAGETGTHDNNREEKEHEIPEEESRPELRRHKSLGLDWKPTSVGNQGSRSISPLFQSQRFPHRKIPGLNIDSVPSKDSVVHNREEEIRKPKSQNSFNSPVITSKSSHAKQKLSSEIANAMDGTRCDDELCCMFQKNMEDLKKLVKENNKKEIISIYATIED